jgi:hypothetical protein
MRSNSRRAGAAAEGTESAGGRSSSSNSRRDSISSKRGSSYSNNMRTRGRGGQQHMPYILVTILTYIDDYK